MWNLRMIGKQMLEEDSVPSLEGSDVKKGFYCSDEGSGNIIRSGPDDESDRQIDC